MSVPGSDVAGRGLVADRPGSGSISIAEGLIVLIFVLVLPAALYTMHRAAPERLLYPAMNLALAAYLFARRSPWYLGQCVLLFCCVSLVRRLVDAQAGWDPSNPVLLTPYLCCLLAIVGFFRYWLQPNPRYIGAFLCLLSGIAYGVVLAVFQGRILAALVDALKWGTGPVFAVYLLSESGRRSEPLRRVAEGCLVWAGALMAIYGVAQYVALPVWDAQWMRNVTELGMDSIGQPVPFAFRVFSTMNSPGSFGMVMAVGVIVGLKRSVGVTAVTVPLMLVGLALCQYRSLWAATAVGVLMIVMQRRAALPLANVVALVLMGVVAFSALASVPRIRQAVVHRASSLGSLKSDDSLKSRLSQYRELGRNEHLIVGEGLAINGASRRLDKGRGEQAIDGAFIEIWRGLGVIAGTSFLLALGVLVGALLFVRLSPGSSIYYDRAIVVATFVQLPIGSVHVGELGFWAYTFMGLGLATLICCRLPSHEPVYA